MALMMSWTVSPGLSFMSSTDSVVRTDAISGALIALVIFRLVANRCSDRIGDVEFLQ
jgi:hypothetical protein